MKAAPAVGDPVTFAGGKYIVQAVWRDVTVTTQQEEDFVLIAATKMPDDTFRNGFQVMAASLREYSAEGIQEAKKAEEKRQKDLLKMAATRDRLRRRFERQQIADKKPVRFKFA